MDTGSMLKIEASNWERFLGHKCIDNKQNKLRGLSPRANYTDRATADNCIERTLLKHVLEEHDESVFTELNHLKKACNFLIRFPVGTTISSLLHVSAYVTN
jgi:hypothetical protein